MKIFAETIEETVKDEGRDEENSRWPSWLRMNRQDHK
jgi:hypothetical protein